MPSDLHQQIAKRAHEIYRQRIGQGALDDWLQAEREIRQDKLQHDGDAGVSASKVGATPEVVVSLVRDSAFLLGYPDRLLYTLTITYAVG